MDFLKISLMAEANLAIIDEQIQVFKRLLQAVQESQADLDDIHSSVNKIKSSSIGTFDTVGMNQEIANSDATKFNLRSANESIETEKPDFLKIQQKIQDKTLKKVVSKVIKLQKDSCSEVELTETTLEIQESSMKEYQRSKIESHGTTELGKSMDALNNSISHDDSSSSNSESDYSIDNISADLLNHISEKQLSYSRNNSTNHESSSTVGLKTIPLPIKASKCSVFSLSKAKLAAKRRKQELRWKLTEISQASPKDNDVLASELSIYKKKRRTDNIPKLKSLGALEAKPDGIRIETRSFTKDPLTMKVICKARNKKAETKIFPLKMSKDDTFVDPETLHVQLKSCIRSLGKDSKSSFVKCHCNVCLSGKPVIGRRNNLLSHLYRTENILLHCYYCDKSTQNMKRMRKHIEKYHWMAGEISQDNHVEDDEEENR